jgi:hypothetical protein
MVDLALFARGSTAYQILEAQSAVLVVKLIAGLPLAGSVCFTTGRLFTRVPPRSGKDARGDPAPLSSSAMSDLRHRMPRPSCDKMREVLAMA